MKKIVILLLIATLSLSVFSGCGKEENRESILKVYNWGDYIDESLIEEFEEHYFEKYGEEIHVEYDMFDTNEIMNNKITKGKEDYDVACPSDYMIERMLNEGNLLPISQDVIDGIYSENVPEFIRHNLAPMAEKDGKTYAAGYMWGTIGIMYNKNEVSLSELEEKGWGVLWDEKYSNKVFMKDSIRDTFATGNLYVFQDEYSSLIKRNEAGEISEEEFEEEITRVFNNVSSDAIYAIEDALVWQKNNVKAMYDVDNDKNAMVNGSAYLDVAWSGDAMWAIWEAEEAENGVELGYYIPKTGTNIWFDAWVIPKYAGNIQGANEWIAFMMEESTAMANMDYIGYTSVVAGTSGEVLEYVSDYAFETDEESDCSYFFGEDGKGVVLNSSMYPDVSIIKSGGIMRDFGKAEGAITEMWSRLKGNAISTGMIVVMSITLAGVVVLFANKIKKRLKHKSKKRNISKKREKYIPE